jgi:hypothetical protein
MAERGKNWVAKREIRTKFKGKAMTLDNAIHALVERKIILAKEGERGIYRLQNGGFALWIKLQKSDAVESQNGNSEAPLGEASSGQAAESK